LPQLSAARRPRATDDARVMRSVVALAVLVAATPAHAGPEDRDGLFGFAAGHAGLGPPVGALGLELGVGTPWLRGAVGAGWGFRGIQYAAMVRLVHPRLGGGLGAGVSRGPAINDLDIGFPGEVDDDTGTTSYGAETTWINLELGFERAIDDILALRFYGGISLAPAPTCTVTFDDRPAPGPCDAEQRARLGTVMPYLGMSAELRIR
jgi:hypothetical protein